MRALRLAEQRTLADAGVSAAQLFVLRQLSDAPAGSLSELGERTLTDRSSVAAVVERLEARGLARRSPSEADRRRTAIGITPAGRALLRRAPQPPTELLIAGLERLGDAALRELARGLERLAHAMGVDARPATMLFEEASRPAAPLAVGRRGARGRSRGSTRLARRTSR